MTVLRVENIVKRFDGDTAVDGVGFTMEEGEILSFLGPSGCGKTTLLRIIAGLERADSGRVIFGGRDMGNIPPHKRNFGMMFQDFALFPHKNVMENVIFGLTLAKLGKAEAAQRAGEVLTMVGLGGFEERSVGALSGGEKQRVALARSLAPRPLLLMLDEPLGSLDRSLREKLMVDLRRIIRQSGVTALFVTHDQAEAFAVSDRIAVFRRGGMEQIDTPEGIYHRPASEITARFLGFANFVAGRVTNGGGVETDLGILYPDLSGAEPGEAISLLLKPDCAKILPRDGAPPQGGVEVAAEVKEKLFQGRTYRLGVSINRGPTLHFDLSSRFPAPRVGDTVRMALSAFGMVVMPG